MSILDADMKPRKDAPRRFRFGLIGSISRFFRKRESNPATVGGMTYEEYAKFAAESPPPQKWWEEDVTGLRGPSGDAKNDACHGGGTLPVK